MSSDFQIVRADPPRPVAAVPIVGGVATPKTIDGAYRIAQLFYQTGMLPQGVQTAEQALVALMAGMEVGLSPTQSLQNVMVVNKRPTVWGDAAIGLVWASGKMQNHDEGVEGEGEGRAGYCTVQRQGDAKPYTVRFTVADARRAGLWEKAGPWKQYPDRMLRLRARAFALRDKFADVLKGLGIREEVEDVPAVSDAPTPPKPRPSLAERMDAVKDRPVQGAGEVGSSPPPPPSAPARRGDADAAITPDDVDAAMQNAAD